MTQDPERRSGDQEDEEERAPDLNPETLKDLTADPEDEEDVRGGARCACLSTATGCP